jgi:hypothetical protein
MPGLSGSGIKCLAFEKRLPWAEVFFFFSVIHNTFETKAIYINSRLLLSLLGWHLAPSLAAEDSKRLVNVPASASQYCAP